MSSYVVTRSLALHSCLWIDIFSFIELRSSTDPFKILISNQLHLENRLLPVSALHENSSFVSHTISSTNPDETYSDYELCMTQPSPQHLMYIGHLHHMIWFQLWWDCEFRTHPTDWFRSDCRKFILKKGEITDLMLCFSKPHQLQTHCSFWPCAVLLAMRLWNSVPQPPTCRSLLHMWAPLPAGQGKTWDWKSRRSHLHHSVSVCLSNWGNHRSALYTNESSCATGFLAYLKHVFGTQHQHGKIGGVLSPPCSKCFSTQKTMQRSMSDVPGVLKVWVPCKN